MHFCLCQRQGYANQHESCRPHSNSRSSAPPSSVERHDDAASRRVQQPARQQRCHRPARILSPCPQSAYTSDPTRVQVWPLGHQSIGSRQVSTKRKHRRMWPKSWASEAWLMEGRDLDGSQRVAAAPQNFNDMGMGQTGDRRF